MEVTREQERAAILTTLGLLFAVLAWVYESYQPNDDHTVLYYRRFAAPICFAFLVARFANYGIHVINNENKHYTFDYKTGTYTLNTEIQWYKVFLVGSHVTLITIMGLEVWLLCDIPALVCLTCILVLQVAETWACWIDMVDARSNSRPRSPQMMV